jgi:hypothetical protein
LIAASLSTVEKGGVLLHDITIKEKLNKRKRAPRWFRVNQSAQEKPRNLLTFYKEPIKKNLDAIKN